MFGIQSHMKEVIETKNLELSKGCNKGSVINFL